MKWIRNSRQWMAPVAVWGVVFFCCAGAMAAAEKSQQSDTAETDRILKRLEATYHHKAFSVDFLQTSTLKAMQIEDTASGHAYFKYPGMMRWEYEKPDKQEIITDGQQLWIYRPDDRQVSVGKFPAFFGDGRGASFLSDIGILRQRFDIRPAPRKAPDREGLILIPHESNPNLTEIELTVSDKSGEIVEIITHNAYGDETRIEMRNSRFRTDLQAAFFHFDVPDNVDVIQLEQE